MAQAIEFGGTNSVPVLDIGMPGGTRDSGSVMELTEQAPNVTTQESATPQVDVLAVQRTGTHGRRLLGRGFLKAASHANLNAIEDDIDEATDTAPTQLANSVTGRTYDAVIIDTWRKIGRRFKTPQGDLVQQFEMVFLDTRA